MRNFTAFFIKSFVSVILISLFANWAINSFEEFVESNAKARANFVADTFIRYNYAVQNYVMANPAVTGDIPEVSLDLPSSFKNSGFTNNVLRFGIARTWLPLAAITVSERDQVLNHLNIKLHSHPNSFHWGLVQSSGNFIDEKGKRFVTNPEIVKDIPSGAILIFSDLSH